MDLLLDWDVPVHTVFDNQGGLQSRGDDVLRDQGEAPDRGRAMLGCDALVNADVFEGVYEVFRVARLWRDGEAQACEVGSCDDTARSPAGFR